MLILVNKKVFSKNQSLLALLSIKKDTITITKSLKNQAFDLLTSNLSLLNLKAKFFGEGWTYYIYLAT